MKKWMTAVFYAIFFLTACEESSRSDLSAGSLKILSEEPFAQLTDSIERFPNDAALYEKRGLLLSQNNLHAQASADYKKASTLAPGESIALLYASSLFIEGKEKEAVKLLKESIKKYPQNGEFRRRLSEAYVQQGKTEEALAQYNEILKNNPDDFEAWYEKAAISARAKDTLTAVSSLERAYTLQPLQLYGVALANLYAETKNAKAITLCDELLARDSLQENGDPFYIKGIYFSNINERRLALEQFEHCIRRDWKFTEAYIEKGILLFEDRNTDEALQTFILAARVSNTNADAYYWQGKCYESISKIAEAKLNYSRAVVLDREFPEAKQALERLEKK